MKHYLEFEYPSVEVSASVGDIIFATSTNTILLNEIAGTGYDPVYYFPEDSIVSHYFCESSLKTHCYLKGDAQYYSLQLQDKAIENAAWCYRNPLPDSAVIRHYYAFDINKVMISSRKNE